MPLMKILKESLVTLTLLLMVSILVLISMVSRMWRVSMLKPVTISERTSASELLIKRESAWSFTNASAAAVELP